jgi:hypothetical protein
MSDEHSFSLHRASTEYRELADRLRELARVCLFPGPRRSLLQLAISFDVRAAHFDCEAARQGAQGALIQQANHQPEGRMKST